MKIRLIDNVIGGCVFNGSLFTYFFVVARAEREEENKFKDIKLLLLSAKTFSGIKKQG